LAYELAVASSNSGMVLAAIARAAALLVAGFMAFPPLLIVGYALKAEMEQA
jgi:hypothetical protein